MPVIARVNGHARAGGLGLIAASDLAVAAEASTFAFSEVRVGVAPAMIMVPALRVVEPRFLAAMTLTGEKFTASEAAGAGLLSAVTADEAALDDWVAARTLAISKSAPGAVRATKALLRNAAGPGLGGRVWRPPRRRRPTCSPGPRRPRGWRRSSRSAGPPGTRQP